MRIDAHQHFWSYDEALYGWMDERMDLLKRDYLPADLSRHSYEIGADATVAVQARQDLDETRWLLSLSENEELLRVRAVVGWVDLRSPEVDAQLDEFCAHPRFKGVRHIVQDEPDDEFLLGAEFCAGIGKLADRDLTYDILIYPKHIKTATQFVDRFPSQPFVLDHLAKPRIEKGELEPWASELRELAKRENVCCKLSGMVTEASWESWKPKDLEPYMQVALEAFGPDRLMYGSDWPVCLLAGEYRDVFDAVDEFLMQLSPDEAAKIFGATASRFYNIQPLA